MGVSVGVLDHFNIRTRNLADTVRFYEDIMGLEKGARPNFAFPGAEIVSRPVPSMRKRSTKRMMSVCWLPDSPSPPGATST